MAAIGDGEQRNGSPPGDERTGIDERLDHAGEPDDAAGGHAAIDGDRRRAPETALRREPSPPQRPEEQELPAPGAPGVFEGTARRSDAGARCDRIRGHRRHLSRRPRGDARPARGNAGTHTLGKVGSNDERRTT
jgi:hypothetical protein